MARISEENVGEDVHFIRRCEDAQGSKWNTGHLHARHSSNFSDDSNISLHLQLFVVTFADLLRTYTLNNGCSNKYPRGLLLS